MGLQLGRPSIVWLAADDPAGARAARDDALSHWSDRSYTAQHYWGLLSAVQADLYEGRGIRALELVDHDFPLARRAGLTRVRMLRAELVLLRAQAALAAAVERDDGGASTLGRALDDLKSLSRDGLPWTLPVIELTRAAAARIAGRTEDAILDLRRAIPELERHQLHGWARVARIGLGELEPNRAGDGLEALEALAGEGVVAPRRFAASLVPGLLGVDG